MGKSLAGLALAVCVLYCVAAVAFADPLKSSHYQFQETSLGGIGLTNTQSANYQAATSGGILGFGNSAATGFQINAGNTTTSDPALAFGIVNPNVNFGNFSPGTPVVSTSSFEVGDYTSYGYVVQVLGNPPANGSHTLVAMSSTGPSQAGVEQYGINLVANTSPVSLGANPDHGQFGVGSAAGNYGSANNYRYVSGETIALAPKSSGTTLYTISYIVNVSSLTPGGQYAGAQTIVCTGTY
jgi:hypothetical protein